MMRLGGRGWRRCRGSFLLRLRGWGALVFRSGSGGRGRGCLLLASLRVRLDLWLWLLLRDSDGHVLLDWMSISSCRGAATVWDDLVRRAVVRGLSRMGVRAEACRSMLLSLMVV